jgi:L-asparaginase / beta-aspartyl-peptidase
MRACLAHEVIARMNYLDESIQLASENSCKKMLADFKGTGGVVGLDREGNVSIAFTSQRMAWAYQKSSTLHYGIKKKDNFTQEVHDDSDFSENEE